jgi:L-2-hydroxyglutarate oxidase
MSPPPYDADLVVVGAGIVGLATARAATLARPGISVLVVDKEPAIAGHQTGHNSGVVHSGIYYRPGSLKAATVAAGRAELLAYCRERGLGLEQIGKVVVATDESERAGLAGLAERAAANGVEAALIDRARLRELEPHVEGVAALHVPSAAIVDFTEISASLADDVRGAGGAVELGREVHALRRGHERVVVETSGGRLAARWAVNCAGLHADVLAHRSGREQPTRIVAFRGEYHELRPERRHLVNALVYPVPDPRFPFLGVHLTPMLDGSVHVGPNAVLALAREGYRWREIDLRELASLVRSPGVRRVARAHWRTGAGEVLRSLSTAAMVRALRRLVPEVRTADLLRAGAGVRAQAVAPDGSLLDDFVVDADGPIVHVLNAPSPAATASLAIGRRIVDALPLVAG